MQTATCLNFLRNLSKQLDELKMGAEQSIDAEKEELGLPQDVEGVSTQKENGILKITVDGYLPRSVTCSRKVKTHWVSKISRAILDVDVSFDKVLCIIAVYTPFTTEWDVDNRAYKYIIDGLRYGGIIKNDNYKNLSFLVTGEVDENYPRTEIYVIECANELQEFLSKFIDKKGCTL
ncbi:MAG: hypothetical protein K9L17_08220 [Clostridiales bacterium]|nr:hypothetical protein [Clostridiales bacterium]MCF8022660.1 hypothetical protein [Clostridiales bacterium]